MKKTGIIAIAIFLLAACNNAGTGSNTNDSTATKDNTNTYDTGAGSSMSDTAHRMDTQSMPNKMQDTGIKK